MHSDPFDPPMPAAEESPPVIDSRAGFHAALRWGVERAVARGARRLTWVDPDFASWPLDDAALLDALAGWLRRPDRQLMLLAATFDEVPRRHPRFVAWRRPWGHLVHGWQAPEDMSAAVPTLLHDDGPVLVRLIDPTHWRGRAALDAREARLVRDEVDALLQRSERSFAANPLGL
jgi:hypothetical protein